VKTDPDGAKIYKKINNEIKKSMKEAKERWIEEKCDETEDNLSRNNSKKAPNSKIPGLIQDYYHPERTSK